MLFGGSVFAGEDCSTERSLIMSAKLLNGDAPGGVYGNACVGRTGVTRSLAAGDPGVDTAGSGVAGRGSGDPCVDGDGTDDDAPGIVLDDATRVTAPTFIAGVAAEKKQGKIVCKMAMQTSLILFTVSARHCVQLFKNDRKHPSVDIC